MTASTIIITAAIALNDIATVTGGKAWGLDKGKARVYFKASRRDTSIFLDFADYTSDNLGGAVLKVFIEACGQPGAWYVSQKRIIMDNYTAASMAAMAYTASTSEGRDVAIANAELAMQVDWNADLVNSVSAAFVNGRIAEAVAAMTAAAA